jgi:WD40 repeat protein
MLPVNTSPALIPVPLTNQDRGVVVQILNGSDLEELEIFSRVCKDWELLLEDYFTENNRVWEQLLHCRYSSMPNFQTLLQKIHSNMGRMSYSLKTFPLDGVPIAVTRDGQLICHKGQWNHPNILNRRNEYCMSNSESEKDPCSLVVDENGTTYFFEDNSVQILDPKDFTWMQTSPALGGSSLYMRCAAVGNGHFFYSNWNTIKVMDCITSNPPACIAVLKSHQGFISSMVVEGDMLISASQDETIKLWKWNSEEKTYIVTQTLALNLSRPGAGNIILDMVVQDSKLFASCSLSREVRVFDLENKGNCLAAFHGDDWGNAIAVKGDYLFAGFGDIMKVWNHRTKQPIADIQVFENDSIHGLVVRNAVVYVAAHVGWKTFSFVANDHEILGEIATQLVNEAQEIVDEESETPSSDSLEVFEAVSEPDSGLRRFSRMSQTIQDQVFVKLDELILQSGSPDYNGCPGDAFYERNGQSATPAQKAGAILAFLESSKLT